jgi:hypothetical protein
LRYWLNLKAQISRALLSEIPFQQKFVYRVKKLELTQIMNYFHAVWSLYCHSKNSRARYDNYGVIKEKEKHKSIPFLSQQDSLQ